MDEKRLSPIPVILDGDPGHDDAIAWVMAASCPRFDIRAVTSVCGNQTIEKTTYNALRICALIGLDAPLAMGRVKPLFAEPMPAANIHGQSGLDGPKLPEPVAEPVKMEACELMAKVLSSSETPVTLISTGPLTNVASLFIAYPELKSKIAHIYLMGGGVAHGNWSPAAEFNILVDPEAADIVFSGGVPITMAGLDVTERALVYPEDFERIRAIGNPVAKVVAEWLEYFYAFHRSIGYAGAPVHDAVAVAALMKPELMTVRDTLIKIETAGQYCRGMTVADPFGRFGEPPNATVIYDIDREAFVDLMCEAVSSYGEKEAGK